MRLHLEGLIAAPHTPMAADGAVDLAGIPALVDHLHGEGVDGLFVLGSTGEGMSLCSEERREVAAAFVIAARGRLRVVVQVGHNSVRESARLAEHAAGVGADAIAAVAPSYFPVRDADMVAAMLAETAGAAPALPFYYYHIPGLSGLDQNILEVLEKARARAPNLAGIKFTAPAVDEFQTCVERYGGDLDMLFGCDELLLSGLVAGAHGAVGSTYNFAAPLYHGILAAFARGDLDAAAALQVHAVDMVRVLHSHDASPAIKATMGLIGCDCGPCRPPLRTLDQARRNRLRHDLEQIGFFSWARRPVG